MRRLLHLLPLFVSPACGDEPEAVHLPTVAPPPALASLPIETRIEFEGSFRSSGVARRADCSIVLVGRTWGTLLELTPEGAVRTRSGHTGTNGEVASLETGRGEAIVVWGLYPALLGVVDSALGVRRLKIPEHVWGVRRVGPTVPLPDGRYALASLSDRRSPVASPAEWTTPPLAQVIDSSGNVVGTVGGVENRGGRYKSWLAARAVLGAVSDTVLVLRLSDATIAAYVPDPDDVAYERVSEVRLPRYIDPPPVREEVVRDPWITVRGDRPLFLEVPQVETAAFAGDRLYAIRNYTATEVAADHARYETDVRWVVREQGLEVYSVSGERLASYALPSPPPTWLRADPDGRIFLGTRRGLLIGRDTSREDREVRRCPRLPPVVRVIAEDTPLRSRPSRDRHE